MRQQAAKVPPYVLGGERRGDGETAIPPSIIPPATVGAAYGQPIADRAGSTGGESSPTSRRAAEEARHEGGSGAESVDRWQRQLAVPRKKEGPGILASAPRHLGDGLLDGVGSILGGVAGGVAGLVALPVIGAKEEGVGGFFKGLGAGVLGAVVLPVTGAVSGVGNIVGGILNTPDTIKSRSEGKEWDPIQKKWVMYNLMEEAQRVLGAESSDASSPERRRKGPSRPGKVQDTHYYDVIGVAPEATADEIKRAYYKAARKVHPDKNPDDTEAHKKFQELSQAYQVLSNDQLRAAYDRDGREAASEVHFMDPTIFFNILFGSERFEPYTGRLRLSDLVSAMGDVTKDGHTNSSQSGDDGDAMEVFAIFGSEKSLKAQNTRAVKCALHLVTLLDRYAGGDVEGFRAWAEKEAEELAKGAFGPSMLYEVGWAYENYAREYVGFKQSFLGVEGIIARSQRTGASMKKQADLSIATLGALKAAQSISMTMPKDKATAAGTSEGQPPQHQQQQQQQQQQPQPPPQQAQSQANTQFMQAQQSAFDSSLPVFLDAMWKLSAYDISETVFATCQKVLRDRSADEITRKKRAEGLLVLGGVFRRVGQVSMSKVERDAKSHMEEAMQKTMAHFQGQEL